MKKFVGLICSGILALLCCTFCKVSRMDEELVQKISQMAEVDNIIAYGCPNDKYEFLTDDQWIRFTDSVIDVLRYEAGNIFDMFGYPSIDDFGEECSHQFWQIVQHMDHDVAFQREVLKGMEKELKKKNASYEDYAYLFDRVSINEGRSQVYGTQVKYRVNGQAYAYNLYDSAGVDDRRRKAGLIPLLVYLNLVTEFHYKMNLNFYDSMGIHGPILYETLGN